LLIYRYLFKQVSSNFAAVAVVLLFIFVSGRFVKYLAEVASGVISSKVLFSILLFRIPGFVELILPLSLFLGVMLAYGRLYVESEMVVLQACGISKRRLLVYTQGPAIIVMLFTALFTLWLTPLGWKHFHAIWNDPDTYSGLGTLVAGNFKQFDDQGLVVYTAEMNSAKTELRDLFVVRNSKDEKSNELVIIKAKSAQVVATESEHGQPYIELYEGIQLRGEPGKLDFIASRYDIYGQRLGESKQAIIPSDTIDGEDTLSLMAADSAKSQAALYWRITMPFIVPIIAIIALALSETTHRKGRYMKLLPGIIIYIVYLAMLLAMRSKIEKGFSLPAPLAFGLVHLLFLLLALVLLFFGDLRTRFMRKVHN
jgi:lipopolysaccharide export system permease protein